ncbi:MAG: HEAT repeat domain-containing protein [Gaiellaceae bacterium]
MGYGRVMLVLLVVLLAVGCGGGSDDIAVDPSVAIESFDASPEAGSRSRAHLNAAVLTEPDASREAALDHLESQDPDVRIAAVYALSITLQPDDADALAPLLETDSSGQRVLAAAGMLAVGDGRAVPVLISALEVEDPLPFGSPPLRVWEQARFALLSFTGEDLGLREAATAQDAAATAAEWESWWASAEGSFEVVRAPGLVDR